MKKQIKNSPENWENGHLGTDEKYTAVADISLQQQIDQSLAMQMISIRLPKELIENFKFLAEYHQMGYQSLMRECMERFAASEIKNLAKKFVSERAQKAA